MKDKHDATSAKNSALVHITDLFKGKKNLNALRHTIDGNEVTSVPFTVKCYDDESRIVYEFHGCYWHGCPTCYPNLLTEIHPPRAHHIYQDLHVLTLKRATTLDE